LCVLTLSACTLPNVQRAAPTPAVPIDLPLRTQAQLRDFDLAVKAVRDQYIDANAAGAGWQSAINRTREQVAQGLDDQDYVDVLTQLLAALNDADLSVARSITSTQSLTSPANASTTSAITSSFSDIGIIAGMPDPGRDRVLVLAVYPNSPAEKGGLKAHDAITRIDDAPMTYAARDTILARLRGESGSSVRLRVRSPGQAERDVILQRAPINAVSAMLSKRIPNTNIGYIRPDPTDGAAMRIFVTEALRDLSAQQTLDGLVLDLRTVQRADFPSTDLLGLFANAQIGTLVDRSGKTKIEVSGKNIAGSQNMPLVVMVSDQTRGVAESFAGILQDLGRARIVGTRTPGRVAVVLPLTLPNTRVQLLIPSGEYRGVKDSSWYKKGIQPDVPSDLTWEQFTDEDDTQLKQAVQALNR
jgi:carboxyl-terminal processing protease